MIIRVLDEIWSLFFVPGNSIHLRMPNGRYTIGSCDGSTNAIYISDEITGELLQDCIQHELAHAYHFASGFGMDKFTEEKMCQFLGHYADEVAETTRRILNYVR